VAWLGPGRLVEDAVVVVEGGRVLFAGSGAEIGVVAAREGGSAQGLSGRPAPPEPDEELRMDGFLMPGVVDRHVHIGLSDPVAVVAGGVTAVRDLAWPADVIYSLAEASESPSFQGPLVRAAGPMLTCPRGYPTRAGWAPRGTGLEVRGSEEAAGAARDLLARGAAVLKVALNAEAGPTLSDDELVAICDVAHAAGTIVTAHVQGRGQAARALGAGVDEFAHCPWSERLSDDLIRAAAKQVRIVSTLDIHSYGRDTPELRTAGENLSRFLAAGGRVAYGTDLGNGPIPAGIHVGEAWHLTRAGLSPHRVMEALTFRPLAPGEPADLVLVGGNPLEDLGALGDVRLVLRAGRRIR
jgi:imidazolonepropionase-like amidohydrolase